MIQIEFEDKLRQMRAEKNNATHEIEAQQRDVKEQIASLGRRSHELCVERKKMEQKRLALGLLRNEIEDKHNKKIQKFIEENKTDERKLSDVSDNCLVNELVARGFHGVIEHNEKSADFMAGLKLTFAGKYELHEEQKVTDDESGKESDNG